VSHTIGFSCLIRGCKRVNYYTLGMQKSLVILGLNATLCLHVVNVLMAAESLEKNFEELKMINLFKY